MEETENAGLVALGARMEKLDLNQAQVARMLGIGADIVSRWFAKGPKRRLPSLAIAVRIENVFGIPVSWWTRRPRPEDVQPGGEAA